MPPRLPKPALLDQEFLLIRAKILEIAAALDRIDRAEGEIPDQVRMDRIRRGLALLSESRPDRAEQVQLAFSLDYDPQWQTAYGLQGAGQGDVSPPAPGESRKRVPK